MAENNTSIPIVCNRCGKRLGYRDLPTDLKIQPLVIFCLDCYPKDPRKCVPKGTVPIMMGQNGGIPNPKDIHLMYTSKCLRDGCIHIGFLADIDFKY
jgi:hypothetical protein